MPNISLSFKPRHLQSVFFPQPRDKETNKWSYKYAYSDLYVAVADFLKYNLTTEYKLPGLRRSSKESTAAIKLAIADNREATAGTSIYKYN